MASLKPDQSESYKRKHALKTRTRKKATAPENPIWIMVSVIGSGKLKYLGESTHYKNIKVTVRRRKKKSDEAQIEWPHKTTMF